MANMENVKESATASQLHRLIKQKRNAELRSILLQVVPSGLIDKQQSTLIHDAVMFNNIDVIALLFGLGFNINARNSIGQTPLLLAAQNYSYQAVQLLLALNADILVADDNGVSALQILLQEGRNTPTHFIVNLFEWLKRSELSSSDIVNELVKAGCPLEHVFMFNDPEITREMLICTNEKDEDTLYVLLKRAMYTMDMANARVFLEYKPHLRARQKKFFNEVTKNIFDPTTKPFFEQLVNWNVIDKPLMDSVNTVFMLAGGGDLDENMYTHVDGNDLEMFLDIGIDKYCNEKFGYALLVSLFANESIDVMNLMRNRQFDVNGRDQVGNTALHMATKNRNVENVAFLLDNGAHPNIKNHQGQTPLFFAEETSEVFELLLEAGADLQALDKSGMFAFDEFDEKLNFTPVKLIILEYQGFLREEARDWLDGFYDRDSTLVVDKERQEHCIKYIQDLDWMKTRMVSESITLFTVLTEKFDRLARYVKDEKTCTEIRNAATSERRIESEYSDMLIKNLSKACEMNKLKRKASMFLSDKMQINDCDHLVIEKIIGFLTYRNLLVFKKM